MMESEGSPRIYRVHHVNSLCRRQKATKEARRTLQQSCTLAFYRPVRWKIFVLVVRAGNTCRKVMGEGGVRVGALIAPLVEELGIRKVLLSFARGAPVSLHASAALLEGEELVLEDVSFDGMLTDADLKLAIVKKILKTEEIYCRTLKSVAKLYETPLRKLLSLSEDDHKRLFDWVQPLCAISNLLIFKLHSSLEDWEESDGKLGRIFSKQHWNYYDSYRIDAKNFTIPLLKEKIRKEEDFSSLLILRQGAAEHSLLDFLHLPLERLVQYDEFLSQLLEVTPQHHPDRSEVFKSSLKVKSMVRRDHSRDEETDLDRIQYLFPNDNLHLYEQNVFSARKGLLRSKSATTLKLHRALSGKSRTLSADLNYNQRNDYNKSRFDRCCRSFIMEGPVQFTMGMQNQDRHLFLFNDILLLAKPRPSGTFRLKEKLLVCELWISDCLEEVCEVPKSAETSFVLGWPTTNVVATFSSFRIKGLWEAKLQQLLQAAHEKELASLTSINITFLNQDSGQERKTTVKVGSKQTASDCIQLALRQLGLVDAGANEFQLWARTGKDESPYPLIGHESPFSIKMNVIRELLQRSELDLRNVGNISTDAKCSFILRPCCHKGSFSPSPDVYKKTRKHRRQTLVNWPFRRQASKQDSLDGESPSASSALFGQPLTKLCDNDRLPTPILGMLTQLYQKGPRTVGIFRKSANARVCRELKERLQSDPDCNLENVPVVVLASVFKEFLRCLPGCLLQAQFYFEWMDAILFDSEWETRERVVRILSKLPQPNLQLLKRFLCVLWHISRNSSENKMSSSNLAVCIGPSLLTPPSVLSERIQSEDASKKVPRLIAFLIDHYQILFGEDCFGAGDSQLLRQDSGAEESDSLREGGGDFQRDDSSIDSLERDLIETSPKLPNKTKVSLTNLSRDSGLTLSDTQLYTAEEELESETSSGGSETRRLQQQQHYYTKSVPHLDVAVAVDQSKVSIDGSCHDVVRKRKLVEVHDSPPRVNLLKRVESGPAYGVSNASRRQRRYEVRSSVEPLQTAGLRRSSSEESLLRKYVGRPQQKRPALHRKGRAPSPPSSPGCHGYASVPGSSSDESSYFSLGSPDPQALWFANHSGTMDWKRSQSTSRIDEIDARTEWAGERSDGYVNEKDAAKSCGELNCVWLEKVCTDCCRNPPSYQEAISRQSFFLRRQQQVTDQMRMEQTNLSAKAKQLYEESVRIYNEQTHRAVPVRIHEDSSPSKGTKELSRLRQLPPVHVSDEQIVRQSRSQKTKVHAWKDRQCVLADLRGEICWSVAQLRTLFTPPQNGFKARNSAPPPYRPPPPVVLCGWARNSSVDSVEESFV